jgi:hypothetical protein
MSILHLPEELVQRLAFESERRQMSVDDLASELVAEGLRRESALDPFTSGDACDRDLAAAPRSGYPSTDSQHYALVDHYLDPDWLCRWAHLSTDLAFQLQP